MDLEEHGRRLDRQHPRVDLEERGEGWTGNIPEWTEKTGEGWTGNIPEWTEKNVVKAGQATSQSGLRRTW